MFVLARSDQAKREQGSSRVGWQDWQSQHFETGDCWEWEPAEHGPGDVDNDDVRMVDSDLSSSSFRHQSANTEIKFLSKTQST